MVYTFGGPSSKEFETSITYVRYAFQYSSMVGIVAVTDFTHSARPVTLSAHFTVKAVCVAELSVTGVMPSHRQQSLSSGVYTGSAPSQQVIVHAQPDGSAGESRPTHWPQ